MNQVFDWVFSQYYEVPTHLIVLELIAVLFGVLSVVYAKKDNIWVYPTGMISTIIFVYILAVYGLLGDMLINAYYFGMSIYGWYLWTRKVDANHYTPITRTTKKEKKQSVYIFLATIASVALIYQVFDKWESWISYTDILTTSIFFVGMWLMAKKKLENWTYWIIGDIISIPLYFFKGLAFSAILYILLTIIAIYGYISWKKRLNKLPQTV
ncbi:nicotinamide riboside transporter PnuC [Haloflavibacter putidus]|uniref:Nicotinamide riboside transporter PnuC n=1 Tax=Haloflavibacter putidus TaxID=2576776 RepID=A0A507ZUL9_9FLAO|nr:nicotinamide riboside transporter PnuC [Haloflavibacter putidus]TQD38495.1 nicotinamide mononucleotide transporter [Haloflavibacter putidus]